VKVAYFFWAMLYIFTDLQTCLAIVGLY